MSTDLTVTRIGHACQLIEIGASRVLADPWFTQTATYYHGEPVSSRVEDLGRVDAVVVSHEHYDHCDLDALVAADFDLDTPLIGPGTVATIARDKGFRDVRVTEAWEDTTVGDLTVTATPGEHGVHEVTFVLRAGAPITWRGSSPRWPPTARRTPRHWFSSSNCRARSSAEGPTPEEIRMRVESTIPAPPGAMPDIGRAREPATP